MASATPLSFLFDLNGTIIDDMAYHTRAWHKILTEDLGSSMTSEEVKMEMYGKNNDLLIRVFGDGHFSDDEMTAISLKKEAAYQEAFRPHLSLIPGLGEFLESAYKKGIPMAIGSAAIQSNIDFIVDNLGLRHYFPAVVSADDVTFSKPHPETFLKCATLLGADPESCIVFEDNPKGVESALRGGMNAVVITTMHEEHEFGDLPNILAFIEDYQDPFLQQLLNG